MMSRFSRHRPAAAILCGALALLLSACGEEPGDDAPAFAVRDSAGVRIAESTRPAWAEGRGWTVGEAPLLEFNTGRPDEVVAVRLPDGRLAVSEAEPVSVRLYDPAGAPAGVLRLPDDADVAWIAAPSADSLLVWDEAFRRMFVLARGGRTEWRVPVADMPYADPAVLGRLPDGTLLATGGYQIHVDALSPRRGLVRHLLLGPDGTPRGVFADLPDVGWVRGNEVPFSPRTVVAVRGTDVLVGDNRSFEFAVYAPGGVPRGIVRRAYTPVAVTPEDVERWHLREDGPPVQVPAEFRALVREEREVRRRIQPAETFPAYERLLADPAGNVWAEESRRPSEYSASWSVFDPNGRWLGSVRMPSGFALRQVGPDWVLGTEPNAAGRTLVRLYPLVKPGGEGGGRP
jgi:hypothetical protein